MKVFAGLVVVALAVTSSYADKSKYLRSKTNDDELDEATNAGSNLLPNLDELTKEDWETLTILEKLEVASQDDIDEGSNGYKIFVEAFFDNVADVINTSKDVHYGSGLGDYLKHEMRDRGFIQWPLKSIYSLFPKLDLTDLDMTDDILTKTQGAGQESLQFGKPNGQTNVEEDEDDGSLPNDEMDELLSDPNVKGGKTGGPTQGAGQESLFGKSNGQTNVKEDEDDDNPIPGKGDTSKGKKPISGEEDMTQDMQQSEIEGDIKPSKTTAA